jgi:NAD(P)-dependent dehydrogenase (short-subunit alcohol dehydrogenase family)
MTPVALVTGAAQGMGAEVSRRLARDGYSVAALDVRAADETVASVTGSGGSARAYRCDVRDWDAVAVRLAEEGADVVVTSRTRGHAEETAAAVDRAAGREPRVLVLDVGDRAAVDGAIAAAVDRFGRIDVLVNNAGFDLIDGPSVAETSDDDWERIFRVNVSGTFWCCRAAIPSIPDGGSIVNLGSVNSLVAWPDDAAYTATKGAVLQFTRALALELAPRGIRANTVCPGVIDTPLNDAFFAAADDPGALRAEYAALHPLNRMGTAREVAHCVLFLASDEASFVTGSALVVDGGMTAR